MRGGILVLLALLAACELDERNRGAEPVVPAERAAPVEPVEPAEPEGVVTPPGTDGAVGTNGATGTDGAQGTNGAYRGTDGKDVKTGMGTDEKTGAGATTPQTGQAPQTGVAPTTTAQAAQGTAKMLSELHQGHVHEIALARLAADRATTPELKDYAQRLLREHTSADDKLVKLARDESITLDEASQKQNEQQLATFQRLEKLAGVEFDREYVRVIIDEHDRSIADVQRALTTIQDAEVKSYYEALLPDLQKHLRDVQEIRLKEQGT